MLTTMAMILALAEPSGAAASPSVENSNPSWLSRPAPEMPPVAMMLGLSGAVSLRCQVNADGVVETCETTASDTQGAGFEEAATAAALRARLNPRVADGIATGASVTFTVRFSPADTLGMPPYAGPEPDAQLVELYRQPLIFGARYTMLACIDLSRLTDEERARVTPHLRTAFEEHRSEWIDAYALAMARVTPPENLAIWRAGDRPPPLRQAPDMAALDQVRAIETQIFARARERYCAVNACPWA